MKIHFRNPSWFEDHPGSIRCGQRRIVPESATAETVTCEHCLRLLMWDTKQLLALLYRLKLRGAFK